MGCNEDLKQEIVKKKKKVNLEHTLKNKHVEKS